jgi:hypothetical protein
LAAMEPTPPSGIPMAATTADRQREAFPVAAIFTGDCNAGAAGSRVVGAYQASSPSVDRIPPRGLYDLIDFKGLNGELTL